MKRLAAYVMFAGVAVRKDHGVSGFQADRAPSSCSARLPPFDHVEVQVARRKLQAPRRLRLGTGSGCRREVMLMVHPINRRPSSSRLSARGSGWRDNLASHGCRIAAMLSVLMLPSSLVAQTTPRNSVETFTEIAKVLTHPRCLNCHPPDDRPRQGPAEATRLHQMNVQRGPDGRGRTGQRCATCHRDTNNAASGVPGVHDWHLAPLSMGWRGLSTAELCRAFKDTTKNGNRSPQDLVEHVATDPFVKWGFEPGGQRAPVPMPHADFIKLVEHWAQTGAECPPS